MADAHSLYSASGADGWGFCFGKPAMEEGRKGTSIYADEGAAAHDLASRVLVNRVAGIVDTAADHVGEKIEVRTWDQRTKAEVVRTFTVDQDMAEHVDTYVDRVMAMSLGGNGPDIMVEQRLHYHEHLGVAKELAWGTGDAVSILWNQPELEWTRPDGVIQRFPPGDELQVHDLKFGLGVLVFADTMQTKLYGGGALADYAHITDFSRIRLCIHQPRKDWFDELVVTPAQLLAQIATLRPAVPKVAAAYAEAKALRKRPGMTDLEVGVQLAAQGYLHPTEKGCRFCDAKAVCPALITTVSEGVSGKVVKPEDFADLTVDGPADVHNYGGNYLSAAFARLELIEGWSNAVRAEIDRRVLLHGEQIDGCKVVAGRKGPRKYLDQGEAEAAARALPAPIRALAFKQTLLTPTQLEKALRTSPNAWLVMSQHIQPGAEGKPAVVPLSDPRAPYSHKAKAEDFEDLTQEQPAAMRGAADPERHPFR